jgi:hypothetical protein
MFSFRSDLTVEHAAMLRRLRRIRLGIMNSDVATFTDKTRRVRTRGARRRRLKRRDIYRMARARTLRRRRRICGYSRKKRTRRRFHNRIIRVPWKPFAYKRKLKRKRKFHVIVKKIRFRRRKRIFLKFRYAYKFRMYRFLVCRITSIFLRFLMKHRYVATAELGHAFSQCIDRVVSVFRSSLHVYTSLLSSTAHSKLASSISYTNGIACYGILLSILSNNMSRQKVIEWVCGVETPRCAVKHEIAAQVSCTTARRYYWFRTHEPDAFVWNLTTPLISDMQHRVCYKRARNTSRRMLFVYGDKICAVSSATSGTRYYSADVHKQRYASWREHSKLYPASTTPLFFVEYVHLSNFHEKNLLFFSYLVRTRGCYVPVNIGMLDLFMNRSAQLSLSN